MGMSHLQIICTSQRNIHKYENPNNKYIHKCNANIYFINEISSLQGVVNHIFNSFKSQPEKASIWPKHVAMFSKIAYIMKWC
jgi:hypothetical protein